VNEIADLMEAIRPELVRRLPPCGRPLPRIVRYRMFGYTHDETERIVRTLYDALPDPWSTGRQYQAIADRLMDRPTSYRAMKHLHKIGAFRRIDRGLYAKVGLPADPLARWVWKVVEHPCPESP
jgi:hypothetical protein